MRAIQALLTLCCLISAAFAAEVSAKTPAALTFSNFGTRELDPKGINPAIGIVGSLCCQLAGDDYSFNSMGFVLTNQPYPRLIITPPVGQGSGYAAAINSQGTVVGVFCSSSCHGFFLTLDYLDGYFPFTRLDFPGALSSTANGINNSGVIVGSYCVKIETCGPLDFDHGFKDDHNTFTTINFPGAQSTGVNGISDSGDMVGSYIGGGQFHGWLLSGGVFTTIEPPGSKFASAEGINNSGVIVGTYLDSSSHTHGFKYISGTYTTIDHPDASATTADGIDDKGEIVGSYSPANSRILDYIGYIAR